MERTWLLCWILDPWLIGYKTVNMYSELFYLFDSLLDQKPKKTVSPQNKKIRILYIVPISNQGFFDASFQVWLVSVVAMSACSPI